MSLDKQRAKLVKEWSAVAGFQRGKINIEHALHSILNNIKERNNKIIRDHCS